MCSYFKTLDKKDCNGCGVCALRCPKKAITMVEDEEGFLYPVIDKEKCINCSLCEKICSNNPQKNDYKIKVYAAKNIDDEMRKNSTSGGMFKLLAENIINKNGVVFGVKYDNNLNVVHDYAENIDDCKKFSISKYVKSNLKNSYRKVEEFLKQDRYVLFTGTPCQNYGLKKYLKRDYEKLILCEIMCHSNPSPKVFKLFLENIEKDQNKKIEEYYFRSKDEDMNKKPYALFTDGTKINYEVYNIAFNKMLISRPSCSKCQFCDSNRKADITIGDFWGIENVVTDFDDEKGVSLLLINSEKASSIFNEIKDKLIYIESNLDDAFRKNHNCNIPEHKKRTEFFAGISNGSINNNNIIKYMKKYIKRPLYRRILGKVKGIIKKIIKK